MLLSWALSAVVAAADKEQTEVRAPATPSQEQVASPSSPGNPKPVPPATFEPSEKIKADSSVSFPVDI